LVADAMTGQDAVNTGQAFHEKVGLSGIVLTRIDGDARGGAALSMRAVTGCPIKLLGTGEKMDALETFHPDRVVGRILGMGDVVGLVEKAQEVVEEEQARKVAAKLRKGEFDLEDMADQLRQVKKMGGMGGIMSMLPGVGKIQKQMAQHSIDDGMIRRQEAIIMSMTPGERQRPALIKASRKRRIAAGSGTSVQEINKLLKQFQQMQTMMKKMKKMGGKLPPMGGGMPGGGLPPGALPPGFGR
jgi:signal recognition particle subunit SRP54